MIKSSEMIILKQLQPYMLLHINIPLSEELLKAMVIKVHLIINSIQIVMQIFKHKHIRVLLVNLQLMRSIDKYTTLLNQHITKDNTRNILNIVNPMPYSVEVNLGAEVNNFLCF